MKSATTTDPRKSETYRRSFDALGAKFALFDQINAICRQFGEPDLGLAVDMVERGLSVDEARRELAKRASVRGWSAALAGVHGLMN